MQSQPISERRCSGFESFRLRIAQIFMNLAARLAYAHPRVVIISMTDSEETFTYKVFGTANDCGLFNECFILDGSKFEATKAIATVLARGT